MRRSKGMSLAMTYIGFATGIGAGVGLLCGVLFVGFLSIIHVQ